MKKIMMLCTLLFLTIVFCQAQPDKEKNKQFLKEQIQALNKIKSLDKTEEYKLDSLFWVELDRTKIQKISFDLAMSGILYRTPIYFEKYYKDEIEKRFWTLYYENANYFKQKKKVSQESWSILKPIIEKRSYEIAFCEVRYFAFPAKCEKERQTIWTKYRKDISDITVKKESKGASYNLGLVLKHREWLKLTQDQIDSIAAGDMLIKELIQSQEISKEKNNRWEYERQCILKTLNEEQIRTYISLRSSNHFKKTAQNAWKDAQKLNIAFEYDSTLVVKQIQSYMLDKETIKYVYMNDPEKLNEMYSFLHNSSFPKILKHIKVEKRKKRSQEMEEKSLLVF